MVYFVTLRSCPYRERLFFIVGGERSSSPHSSGLLLRQDFQTVRAACSTSFSIPKRERRLFRRSVCPGFKLERCDE